MTLADRVRIRREELGLSQEQLALRMGYSSRTSINKIENGRPCSQKIIARLADALNVSIPYLMGWEDKEHREIQKKNDTLSDIVLRMQSDDVFMSAVESLYKLDQKKLSSILTLLD